MAFSTMCYNKGCGKIQEPFLDPTTNQVFCSICEGEITNLTHFVKVQMKSSKQFRPKKMKPFVVKCPDCQKEDTPIVVNSQVVCASCQGSLPNLSSIFKNMLKQKL